MATKVIVTVERLPTKETHTLVVVGCHPTIREVQIASSISDGYTTFAMGKLGTDGFPVVLQLGDRLVFEVVDKGD